MAKENTDLIPYSYKATNSAGKTVSGKMDALNVVDLDKKLKAQNLELVKSTKLNATLEKLNKIQIGGKEKLTTKDLILFCSQLHSIVTSGVSLLVGLDILGMQSKNKKLQKFIKGLLNDIQKGIPFAQALKNSQITVPSMFVSMVGIGEQSGNLEEIFKRVSVYYERENFFKGKLQGAMTYPIILTTLGSGMVVFFVNFVLPDILKTITESGKALPSVTLFLLAIINYVKSYGINTIIGILLTILAVKIIVPKKKLRFAIHKVMTFIPILNVCVQNLVTARFLRTFSIMLKSGLPVLQLMDYVEQSLGNGVAEESMRIAKVAIQKGERLSKHMNSLNFFDPMLINMMSIGEETGQLEYMLENMANYYDKESEESITKVIGATEPIFTIGIGIAITFILLAVMVPMFQMTSGIGGG